LAAEFAVGVGEWPPAPGWNVLVNTTPVGTSPRTDESPIERLALAGATGAVVYDLVYNPPETTLMRWASDAGAEVIGGLEMLVSQACRQLEWWTNTRAPRAIVEAAARAFVGTHETNDV
jgi:shikimate 5-dehydrogenase